MKSINILLAILFTKLALVNAQSEIKVQLGHADIVSSAVFSPNGKHVVSFSKDGVVILWDVTTGKELRRIEGQLDKPSVMAFSPDGKVFLVGTYAGNIVFNDVSTSKVVRTIAGHKGVVSALAFSPCGRYLVSGSWDNSVKLWDVSTGVELQNFVGHSNSVNSVAISSDNKFIASGADDKTARIWDAASGKEIKRFEHAEKVIALAFANNGKNLLVGARNEIKSWNMTTGHESLKVDMPKYGSPLSIAFSSDGMFALAGFSDRTMKVYNLAKPNDIRNFSDHSNWVLSVAVSFDGSYGLAGAGKELKLWDLKTGQEVQCFKGFSNFVYSVSSSPNDRFILTATAGRLCEWEVSTGKLVRNVIGNEVFNKNLAFTPNGSAIYSPDGKNVLAAYNENSFKVWNTANWNEILNVSVHGKYQWLLSLSASPDGKLALTGSSEGILRLWDLTTGKEVRSFKGHTDYIYSTAISPDGKFMLSGGSNGNMKLWSLDGTELHTFWGHKSFVTSITFSSDSKLAVSSSLDKTIKIWDLSTRKELRTLNGHLAGVTSVAISPDGKFILSGSMDKSLKTWDLSSGKELYTLLGHLNAVRSVAFSRNGLYAYSGSDDGTIRVWDVKTGKQMYAVISTLDGNYLAWTPDGYFEGSQELAKKMVYIINGMSVINIDQLSEQFYQPGIIAARMDGSDIAPPGIKLAQIKLPPQVQIINPINNDVKTDAQIAVTVKATDMGSGIDEIRLYLNGKLVDETQRGMVPVSKFGSVQSKTFTVPLVDGENKIRAVAYSNQRVESLANEILVQYKAPKQVRPNMYILAIGINTYQNPRYNLNYAVNDASAFVKTLKEGAKDIFQNVTIQTVFDTNATREGILSAIDKAKSQVNPEDVFVLYYAGHGVMSSGSANERPEFYLVPHDITKMFEADNMLKSKGISAKEIGAFSKSIRSQKQLFLLDACQSGGAIQTLAMRGAAEEKAIAQLSRSTGTYFIAASGTEQFATEVATLGHGIFTYSIIEALKGQCKSQDGRLTVNLLKGCVEDMVPELSKKYKGSPQFPTGYGFGQDFPIVIVK